MPLATDGFPTEIRNAAFVMAHFVGMARNVAWPDMTRFRLDNYRAYAFYLMDERRQAGHKVFDVALRVGSRRLELSVGPAGVQVRGNIDSDDDKSYVAYNDRNLDCTDGVVTMQRL